MTLQRSRRLIVPTLLFAFALLAIPAKETFAQKVPTAKRLPKDVFAYFSIPSVTEFKKRFSASSTGMLLKDKALDDFLSDIKVQLKAASGKAEKATGFSLDQLIAIPSGEFSVAVVKSKGAIPGVVVFLDFGTSKSVVTKLLGKAEQAAKANGAGVTEEKSGGVSIKVITPPGDGSGEEGASTPRQLRIGYFVKGTHLVFGTDIGALKNVVARWDGKLENSFADHKVHSYISSRCRTDNRDPALEWYVNPMDLIQHVISTSEDIPAAAKGVFAFLPLLGITKFRGVGGSVDMVTKEFDYISKTLVYVDQPATGLLNLFRFPAVKQSPPKWVSENASSYTSVNWDFKSAYTSVETMFNMINALSGPDALGKELQKLADDPNGPGIHLKKDVIDQLSGQIQVISEIGSTENGPSVKFNVVLGMRDEKKANALIAKIVNHPAFPGKSRKVNGRNLYELDLGATFGGNTGAMGFAVTQDGIVFCSDVKQLESIMMEKAAAKPLVDSAAYKRIAARFPAKTSMISYSGVNSQIGAIWDQLRGEELPIPVPGIDFGKLPKFSVIKKYLQPSGSYTIPDKNGAYMESFYLRRK